MKNRIFKFLVITALICSTAAAQPQRSQAAAADAEREAEQKRAEQLTEFIKANYTKYENQISDARRGPAFHRGLPAQGFWGKVAHYDERVRPTAWVLTGSNNYLNHAGSFEKFARDKFIFVYQDVRGRYLSEGTFVDVRPAFPVRRRPRTSMNRATPTTQSSG